LLHHKPANDLLRIEINGIGFHWSALSSSQALLFEAMAWYTQFPFGLERGDLSRPRAGPAPPARRTGVASGVLGQDGYGSLRHASPVDWFVA